MESWQAIYDQTERSADQPAFRQALFETDANISTIPTEYNCRWPLMGYICGKVKVFHGRLEDYKDISGVETKLSVDEAVEKTNQVHSPRVFFNNGREIIVKEY